MSCMLLPALTGRTRHSLTPYTQISSQAFCNFCPIEDARTSRTLNPYDEISPIILGVDVSTYQCCQALPESQPVLQELA